MVFGAAWMWLKYSKYDEGFLTSWCFYVDVALEPYPDPFRPLFWSCVWTSWPNFAILGPLGTILANFLRLLWRIFFYTSFINLGGLKNWGRRHGGLPLGVR